MEYLLSIFLIISLSLFLLLGVRIAYSIWWKPKKLEKLLKQQGIKGSPYRIFFGDLKKMEISMKEAWSKPMNLNHQILPRAIPFIHQTLQKYGKTSMVWIGATPRVIIMDSELIKEVLSDKSGHIQKPPSTNPLINILAMGVSASLEGEEWFHRRRLINPAFHQEKLKQGMIHGFSTCCDKMIKRWVELVGPEGGCEVDVWPELQNFTGDVISRTAFGSNYEEGRRIFQLQKEQVELFIDASMGVYIPGFRFLPTKKNKRRLYLDKEIKGMLRDLINRKEMAMKMGGSRNDDLLGLLLHSINCENAQENGRNSNKHGLTIEDVIEECKLFYFAGQESSAVLLTWTMIVLSMHPRWQEEAREEVMQICGKESPDFESISHLKIVTMILYEVLRLYPSAIALYRYTMKTIKLGDMSLPAGVELYLPTMVIHHDSSLWGEDAQQFKPERFSEGVARASKNQNAFFPFGWGPRICVGQNFAMIEAKMALATILQNFSFELSPTYTHAPYTIITLQPQHGAQIILRKL